jgi:hypothetical protein
MCIGSILGEGRGVTPNMWVGGRAGVACPKKLGRGQKIKGDPAPPPCPLCIYASPQPNVQLTNSYYNSSSEHISVELFVSCFVVEKDENSTAELVLKYWSFSTEVVVMQY